MNCSEVFECRVKCLKSKVSKSVSKRLLTWGGVVASCRCFRREKASLEVPLCGEVPHSQELKLFVFLTWFLVELNQLMTAKNIS